MDGKISVPQLVIALTIALGLVVSGSASALTERGTGSCVDFYIGPPPGVMTDCESSQDADHEVHANGPASLQAHVYLHT